MRTYDHIKIRAAIFLFFIMGYLTPVYAQQISTSQLEVYVQSDTLKLDVRIDSAFTQDHIHAVESGMTASIALQLRLLGARKNRIVQFEINKQLEHDIWEGQYRLISQTPPPDTLTSTSFEEIRQAATRIQGIALTGRKLPNEVLTLQARIHINPITPEQQARTRRWLKILRKGSLLEFFFSFRKSNPPTPWITLYQFRPSALPHLLQEPSQ
ncbi:MAG: DUF4390 domain-containing protein [Candidatus Latescibacteria bacterium]|jgi:hypothetical protein|nr:DUF4390 domain-containing protein [Candidatus Latescibacterota bacterium]MBT4137916.1 DUF4390 domain-containing protein [Candidatus Latescibacterota bacterium]MBT5829950.1 DUF4390 domain-containing protein [Candidatus Latescibacterota bacterium]